MFGSRLADAIDRADLHRAYRRRRAALGDGRDHDDRQRAQPHHLLEEVEAVHLRHLDVERHDIGIERFDRFSRLKRIGGLTDNQDRWIGRQLHRN